MPPGAEPARAVAGKPLPYPWLGRYP